MKHKLMAGFVLMMAVILSGCTNPLFGDLDMVEPGCTEDADCGLNRACIEESCTFVMCTDDSACLDGLCIDYGCVYLYDECKIVAVLDYNMTNPMCDVFRKTCWCKDRIIDVEEKRMEKEHSIVIIPAEYHDTERIKFELKI